MGKPAATACAPTLPLQPLLLIELTLPAAMDAGADIGSLTTPWHAQSLPYPR
jgi:hypothetical protein